MKNAVEFLRREKLPRGPYLRWCLASSGAAYAFNRAEREGIPSEVLWFGVLLQAGYSVEDQRQALYYDKIPWIK